MRMLSRFLTFLVMLLPFSATAQSHPRPTLTVRAVWMDPHLSFRSDAANTLQPRLDRSSGAGVAVNSFLSDALSLELAAMRTKSELTASTFSLGSLRVTPLSATVQYHLAPKSMADFYAGAGGAYALFGSVRNGTDFPLFGYSSIDFKNRLGWLVNGGANVRLHPRWSVNFDAKYMRFNVSSSAMLTDGTRTSATRMRLSPLTLAGGATFHF